MAQSLAEKILPKPLKDELDRYLNANVHIRANPENGEVSFETRRDRRKTLFLSFAQLWEMGFRMRSVAAIGERHIRALVDRWDKEGLAAGTLHTRISYLSTFCGWVGKPGMVKGPAEYLSAERVHRTQISEVDKTWEGNGLVPAEVLAKARELDERFGLYLALQNSLGLRVKESLEFRPALALKEDGKTVEVFEGTKGGRRRSIDLVTPEQVEVMAWAMAVAKKSRTGRLRWPGLTFKQAQRRFYHLMAEHLGISRKEAGVTAHGLRHGFANRGYNRRTGLPTPVQGGALGRIDRETHRNACQQVSKDLGHARLSITGTYYGSYGHALRNAVVVEVKDPQLQLKFNASIPGQSMFV